MREKETQKKQDDESQSIFTASPVEQARTTKSLNLKDFKKYGDPILICDSYHSLLDGRKPAVSRQGEDEGEGG